MKEIKKMSRELFIEIELENEVVFVSFDMIAEWFEKKFKDMNLRYEIDLTFNSIRVLISGDFIDLTDSKELAAILSLGSGISIYPCLDGTVTLICGFKLKV